MKEPEMEGVVDPHPKDWAGKVRSCRWGTNNGHPTAVMANVCNSSSSLKKGFSL